MTSKKPKTDNSQFVCFVYDGYLKRTTLRFFIATSGPDAEFEKHRVFYGTGIKGRYVRVENCAESFAKLKAELAKRDIPNCFGDLYELGPSDAAKVLKDACNVQKAHLWGQADETAEAVDAAPAAATTGTTVTPAAPADKPATEKPATKKVIVKGKTAGKKTTTPKVDPQEIDNEDDECEPADVPAAQGTAPAEAKPAAEKPKPKAASAKKAKVAKS
ncbi:MAG: hypothetical protein Hyperionvirus9_46 [Hyperionvirus sp.]|uniref:Uncharacterized protein n=1 Tax=Hyperionvirus sp. TaxID=2487770 RepID=A0A3G5AE32_9VIRU|nr:MAG: hypothetical protein Hyperionvirus9_46 [Hyperionvirus sp.]